MINDPNFEVLFKATPAPYLILSPDAPHFTILEVNEAYCRATRSSRTDLLGKGIFEAFPDNHLDPASSGVANLRRSLMKVVTESTEDRMAIQQYDIPVRGKDAFQVRYWSPVNYPVLDAQGQLLYIIHSVTDLTNQVLTEKREKATQLELMEHREHYRSLFENNPDAVYSFDLDGIFLSANEKLAEMLECSVEDLRKSSFMPFVAPEDAAQVMECFRKAGKGEIQHYTATAFTARGKRLEVQVTNLPINIRGEIVGVYGIAKDISQAVRGEQLLRQQEQLLNKIMDYSRDVICIIDEHRTFLKISKACLRLWGYRPEELEGTCYMDLIVEKDQTQMNATAEDLRKGFDLRNIENHYRHRDGRIITMSWSAHWDPEEKVSYCVGRDITEEKSAAERILENERRFKTLLQNSTDGLALLGSDGRMTEISETGLRILGYAYQEVTGHVRPDLIHPEDLETISQAFMDVLNDPERIRSFEYRLLQPSGKYKWIEANFQNQLGEPAVNALVMNFRDITERKTVSEKLRSSEDRYRYLFQHNPMPMWVYDTATHHFLEVNQAAIEKYGYSKEEFLKMTIEEIRPKEDIQLLRNFTSIRTGYGTQYKGYWRHLKKNGEVMYVDITSHLIDYNGLQANLILSQDVSEKVKSEDAIRKSEEIRSLIMNSALDAIICMDTTGNITLWNDQAEKVFGWKRGELLGKRLSEHIFPEHYRKKHESELKRYMETGTGHFINRLVEVTALDWKGIEFPIELTIAHIRHRGSEFFCAYIRDITERNHQQTALDRSEKRYKTLVQEGSDLINILNEKGEYMYVSPTYLSQLGYTEEELMGRNVFDLIHEDDRGHVLNAFERLKENKRAKSLPFRFRDGKNEYRWLESVGTNLLADPSINGLVINSKDVTERMDYIRAIELQNSRLREIAWTQSHVVRAPLSRIMGIVDVLTNYPEVDSRPLMTSLIASAHELDGLVRSIVKSTEQIGKQ